MEELLKEQRKTNELLEKIIANNKDPYELLTIEQVHKEYGIGLGTVQKMFKDPELQVQRYTTPYRVMRHVLNEYLSKKHDYLSER